MLLANKRAERHNDWENIAAETQTDAGAAAL